MTALERWAAELAARAIPERIMELAPEPPWGFPTELFRRRGSASVARGAASTTTRRALEALPEGGTVLDVGVGGGATSLPLASRAGTIVGVDAQEDMLETFASSAAEAGVATRTVVGAWPEVAGACSDADVVVCGHVLYNVTELSPFAAALDSKARRRVVAEITERHPLAWMNDLWMRFWDLDRPDGPTASGAVAALSEAGFDARREDRVEEGIGGFERMEDSLALVRRRLCLPADRDSELIEALGDRLRERDGLWSAGPASQPIVTLWWDVASDRRHPRRNRSDT